MIRMPFRSVATALAVFAMAGCAHAVTSTSVVAPQRALFLLAGQSNMAGRGAVEADDRMLDRTLAWVPATDPVHFDKPSAGVGPGRAFAIALHERDTSAIVGLVPTAVGGSPISSWEPGALDVATKTHPYDDAITRARAAMRDGTFRAILWHQGESDATPELSVAYAERLRALITRFRTELGDPNLPFLIGELGQFPRSGWSAAKVRVDSVHRALAGSIPGVAYVSSDGLRHRGDSLHFDSASARELGRRYAAAYLALTRR
jgi:hypothetical protein